MEQPEENERKPKAECTFRPRKTPFVDLFRTTPPMTVCPNFYVLSHANGCSFSPPCTYCYLKSSFWFLDRPHVFSNVDNLLDQVRTWISSDNLETYVLNAGNLSDSLAFEDVRPLFPDLVSLFRSGAESLGRPHTLLLVTKGGTKECEPFLELAPCRNVVFSFSLNTPDVARVHESGAAPPVERLEAALALKKKGWRIRVRIDPMMLWSNYEDLARSVADLGPERVTLGALRAERGLGRFVGDDLFRELDVPGDDPKALARYPLDKRLTLYRQVSHVLQDVCSLGLCEETREVWTELGIDPDSRTCNCGL